MISNLKISWPKAILFLFLIGPNIGLAKFSPILSFATGMVNSSITENEAGLVSETGGETESTASSAAVSAISANVNYEFSVQPKKTYYIAGTAPLLTSQGTGFFMIEAGINFYVSSMASLFSYNDNGSSLTLTPTTRFYWGPGLGVGGVIYNVETRRAVDLIFDISLHGGMVYNFNKKYGLKLEGAFGRGTGSETSSINIRFFAGLSYFIDG